jgi:hypothetical protein
MQHLELLLDERPIEECHARDVAARSVETADEADCARICSDDEDDRDRFGCGLGGERRRRGAYAGDHVHLAGDKIGCQRRKTRVVALRPAILGGHVPPFDKAALVEAAPSGR